MKWTKTEGWRKTKKKKAKRKQAYIEYLHGLTPGKSPEGLAIMERRQRMDRILEKRLKWQDEFDQDYPREEYEKAYGDAATKLGVMRQKNPLYEKPKYGRPLRWYESFLNWGQPDLEE